MKNHLPNLLPKDGEVFLRESVWPSDECKEILNSLIDSIPWRQDPITIFGKTVLQPRLTAWMGDPGCVIRYSGISMEPEPWSGLVLDIKNKTESLSGHSFNGVLLNYYRNGLDTMGWHQDNEVELGPKPYIASVSFGVERRFRLKHANEKINVDLDLSDGSLLVMAGECQKNWYHCLPKRTRIQSPRINLTFRKILS